MWQQIALLSIGFSAGLLVGYIVKKGPTHINAKTYNETSHQETKVRKIKQKKGEGNEQVTEVKPKFLGLFRKKGKAVNNNQKSK